MTPFPDQAAGIPNRPAHNVTTPEPFRPAAPPITDPLLVLDMPLGDDLFLIALDDRCRWRRPEWVVGLALGGALLGELLLTRHITLHLGHVRVPDQHHLPADPLANRTLARIIAEPATRSVREWLDFLADTAIDAVADRMQAAGRIVRLVQPRRFRSPTVAYIWPGDRAGVAAWRPVRLNMVMDRRGSITWQDVLLAGLVVATGLADSVMELQPRHERAANIRHVLGVAQGHAPDLWQLVSEVQAAAGDGVLTHRH